jgi:polar amino acid transport system ATP-binding protein
MVMVSHETPFAREAADRALFMNGGASIEEGPGAELIDPASQNRYSGLTLPGLLRLSPE